MANVLIVDDSKTSRKILRATLEEAGYTVVGEAGDGAEGVEMYKTLKPDVVTMDITMPNMDGIVALSEIMGFDVNAKVIMVTAAGQKTKMIEAIKAGATDFIPKPFEPETVIKTIEKAVK